MGNQSYSSVPSRRFLVYNLAQASSMLLLPIF